LNEGSLCPSAGSSDNNTIDANERRKGRGSALFDEAGSASYRLTNRRSPFTPVSFVLRTFRQPCPYREDGGAYLAEERLS
jgi:hypothetical protein